MRTPIALAALLPALLTGAGCGGDAGDPDPGTYPTVAAPADYDDAAGYARGILVESLRIGETVISAQQIESDLVHGRGGGVLVDHAGTSGPLPAAVRTALAPFEVLGGFGAVAADSAQTGGSTAKSLTVAVLALPSVELAAAAAGAAAAAADAVDTLPLGLSGTPAAQAYWRPATATAGGWLSWKSLVIGVSAKFTGAAGDQLADVLSRAVRAQVSALTDFVPTPPADLPKLKLDPDRLLTGLVRTGADTPDRLDFAVYGPRAHALLLDRPATRLAEFREQGVTSIALSHNNQLYRTRDAETAEGLVRVIGDRLTGQGYVRVDAGPGVTGVSCYAATQPEPLVLEARRYACLLHRADIAVRVNSNQEADVRRLAAAQSILLGQDR
ncbi:DUF7373 family lipoprotein [Nocardia sp. NPDC055321]